MYKIDETDQKSLPYYTARRLYRRSSDKRQNLYLKIYDNLEQPYFEKVVKGNKAIAYDHILIVIEEFQLKELTDQQLWKVTVITWEILKKKYNNLTNVILSETFEEIEKYLRKEGIRYGRIRKYCRPNNIKSEVTDTNIS